MPMVKIVADVERCVIAIGGELHADAEQLLLDAGSRQNDLWGANYYPALGKEECIECTALINQQILRIGNEMNRAGKMMGPLDGGRRRAA